MRKKAPKSIWIRSVVIITGLTIFIAMGWSMYQKDAAKPQKPAAIPKNQANQSKHTT
ncbi:glycoside hydrolase family 32 protein, partial [Bacillus cereus]|nr:glycoside hydrolase family 32 protein [Bacillus cereus]